MNIKNRVFNDKQEWKPNEGTFKTSYWQFEFADPYGKLLTLNSNPAGLDNLYKSILDLNLMKYETYSEFNLTQEIEARKCLEAETYEDFNDGDTEEERDEYLAYCGGQDLTGYHLIPFSSQYNMVANGVVIKWYPGTKGRVMALSINSQQRQISLHLNPEGYKDWICILELYRDKYPHFDLFKPRHKIITKFGSSGYFLTELPLNCMEELVVHLHLWRDYDIPKVVNLISYPFLYEGCEEQLLVIQSSPRGALELEAVVTTCIENFSAHDYLDYQLTCSDTIYDKTNYEKLRNYSEQRNYSLQGGTTKFLNKIRFVFLKDKDLYLFSAEYDAINGIVYFYISYPELFKLLNKVRTWQAKYTYLAYEWNIKNNLSIEEFIHDHKEYREYKYHLANVKYGAESWYKFPLLTNLSCYSSGELFSLAPISNLKPWNGNQAQEQDDEYNIYRTPNQAFIINYPHGFMLNPIKKLNPPRWQD